MAKIKVMNPPKWGKKVSQVRRAHRTAKVAKKVMKVVSTKVTTVKRKSRRVRKQQRKTFSSGVHRPVITVKHGKIYRGRKRPSQSRIPPRAAFVNPFGSELVMVGNPKRRNKRRTNIMARKRRHHRRKSYAISNPFSVKGLLLKPKEMISKDFAIDAVFAAAGFILPQFAKQYIPANFQNTKIKYYAAKVGTVALLSVAAGMVSKKASRMVLLGGTVSILLDVWTEFRARTSAPAGTNAYYGQGIGDSEAYEPGVDVWYGGPQETLDADNSAPIFPNQNSDSGLLFDDEIDEQNGF